MEEYRSNSIKTRDGEKTEEVERHIETIEPGSATIRKKTSVSKIADNILVESFKNVGSWLLSDVIIPNIKKGLYDIIVNGTDMLLYGKSGSPKSGSSIQKISYGGGSYYNYSKQSSSVLRAGSGSKTFECDEIVFESRGKADEAIERMRDVLDAYEEVTVADLYEIARVPAPDYPANGYGWRDLRGIQSVRCRDGYVISLPPIISLSDTRRK